MTNSKKMMLGNYPKDLKKNKKIMLYLFIFGLLLLGVFYQLYGIYSHANEYGRTGKLIDVNGVALHLYTSGSSSIPLVFTPTVGAASPYTAAYPLTSQIPETVSIGIYDKPGYGWSDLTKSPRDIDTITAEIHTLLEQANYTTPPILVAHSLGSLEVLRYAQLYPDEVSGIVLIDGAAPEFCSSFNNIMIVESFLTSFLRNTGILRLTRHTDSIQKILNPNPKLPDELKNINQGISLEKLWNRNVIEEKLKMQSNAKIILEGGTLGDIPLRIITSKANPYGNWNKTQSDMLKLSSDSIQLFIDGSVNYIEYEDTAVILDVIEELVTSIEEKKLNEY
ncbi:MAG: alpha/beta hydrolase [Clostridia bacterium]|jgi:hypothetical protein|nr:alpha/beta hydrolase [Clostridia bacterium]